MNGRLKDGSKGNYKVENRIEVGKVEILRRSGAAVSGSESIREKKYGRALRIR